MSTFNDANQLASALAFGTDYNDNPLDKKPERLVFVNGDSIAVVTAQEGEGWACVGPINRLLDEGYDLGCDMNVAWNGRYDIEGDPMPDGDQYRPCAKPVAVYLDGRHLCEKHDPTDGQGLTMADLNIVLPRMCALCGNFRVPEHSHFCLDCDELIDERDMQWIVDMEFHRKNEEGE